MSEPLRIGLLGRGTVGGALEALIAERGPAIEAACGRPFEISGVLTTSEGDFGQILASSDVIVELIGGVDDARRYVMAALEDGKPVVTANKQLVARYGDELFRAAAVFEQLGQGHRLGMFPSVVEQGQHHGLGVRVVRIELQRPLEAGVGRAAAVQAKLGQPQGGPGGSTLGIGAHGFVGRGFGQARAPRCGHEEGKIGHQARLFF